MSLLPAWAFCLPAPPACSLAMIAHSPCLATSNAYHFLPAFSPWSTAPYASLLLQLCHSPCLPTPTGYNLLLPPIFSSLPTSCMSPTSAYPFMHTSSSVPLSLTPLAYFLLLLPPLPLLGQSYFQWDTAFALYFDPSKQAAATAAASLILSFAFNRQRIRIRRKQQTVPASQLVSCICRMRRIFWLAVRNHLPFGWFRWLVSWWHLTDKKSLSARPTRHRRRVSNVCMRLDICFALFVLGFQLQLPVNLFTFNQYPTTPPPPPD